MAFKKTIIMSEKNTWLGNIIAGALTGILLATVAVAIAALVFSGPLSTLILPGVVIALVSAIILNLVNLIWGQCRFIVLGPQDTFAVIAALLAASIVGDMPTSDMSSIFVTVVVSLALMSLLLGIVMASLGVLRLGNIIQFIPYPVIGGFLAGTGILILLGASKVLTGMDPSMENIPKLFDHPTLLFWGPAFLYALFMLIVSEKTQNALLFPVLLALLVGLFYLFVLFSPLDMKKAMDMGLLLGPFQQGETLPMHAYAKLSSVNWTTVTNHMPDYFVAVILGCISLLLNVSSIEVGTKKDLKINSELKVSGIGNVFVGLLGGFGGYHLLGLTTVSHKLGVRSYLAPISMMAVCTLVLIFGISYLQFLPRMLMGSFLAFLGFYFVYQWLVLSFQKLAIYDYFIIIFIAFCIVYQGLISGVLLGIMAALVIFVIQYSRTIIVKNRLTGKAIKSKRERASYETNLLTQYGDEVYVLILQGYLFFGNVNIILHQVIDAIDDSNRPIKYVILDFNAVSGIDISARYSFSKLSRYCIKNHVFLVYSGLSKESGRSMVSELRSYHLQYIKQFPVFDEALNWCEEGLIKHYKRTSREFVFANELATLFPRVQDIDSFIQCFIPCEYHKDDIIYREGDPSDDMYIIEIGSVNVIVGGNANRTAVIKILGPGAIIGEMGLFLDIARSATVIAKEDCLVHRLTRSALQELEERDPTMAKSLYHGLFCILAKRLVDSNQLIKQLSQ